MNHQLLAMSRGSARPLGKATEAKETDSTL
jgi:hypothetical protein